MNGVIVMTALAAILGLGVLAFLLVNSVLGMIGLFLFNILAGKLFDMRIKIGCLNTCIVGIFGVAGLLVVVVWNLICGTTGKDTPVPKA